MAQSYIVARNNLRPPIDTQDTKTGRLIKEDDTQINEANWMTDIVDPLSGVSVNTNNTGGSNQPVTSIHLSALGLSKRVLFDTSFNVPLDTTEMWDVVVNDSLIPASRNASVTDGGTTIGPADVVLGMVPISTDPTVGADATTRWIFQSRESIKFRTSDQTINFLNGLVADSDNSVVNAISIRSFEGFQEDIDQADWNIDSFGAGILNPSEITLDFNKIQTIVIHSFYKGAGAIKVGFLIKDTIYYGHEFAGTNSDAANPKVLPVRNLNTPLRMDLVKHTQDSLELRCGLFDNEAGVALSVKADTSVSNPIVNYKLFGAASFSLGESNSRAYPFSEGTRAAFKNITQRTPIVSFRARTTYFSEVNKVVSKISSVILNSSNADLDRGYIVEVIFNGTLVGDSFTDVDTLNSTLQFDTAATSISNGILKRTYGSFPNSSREIVFSEKDVEDFIQRIFHTSVSYSFAGPSNSSKSDTITFVATPRGASSEAGIDVNWNEFV